MSDLRNKLNEARRAYQGMEYPGDLATELLRPGRVGSGRSGSPQTVSGRLAAAGFACGLAALIALAFWAAFFAGSSHPVQEAPLALEWTADDESDDEALTELMAGVPDMPAFGPLWQEADVELADTSSAVPSFPSLTELMTEPENPDLEDPT